MPPNNQHEKPAASKSQPSPLADPVAAAIFKDVIVSGLAVQSLTNAVLKNRGRPPVAEICSVTPQRVHPTSGKNSRFYRVDVEALSEKGESVLLEFQLAPFKAMTDRNLLYGQDLFARWPSRGDVLNQAVAKLPRVIAINLLDFVLRPSSNEFHQLAGLFFSIRRLNGQRATWRSIIFSCRCFRSLNPITAMGSTVGYRP